jgi:hypothetical protein
VGKLKRDMGKEIIKVGDLLVIPSSKPDETDTYAVK